MTVFEKMRGAQIQDYYPTMWMDGYEPWEILQSVHKTMREQDAEPDNLNINVEVNKK